VPIASSSIQLNADNHCLGPNQFGQGAQGNHQLAGLVNSAQDGMGLFGEEAGTDLVLDLIKRNIDL
jgi:hypothetical protein